MPLLDVVDSASGNTPLMYATMANKIQLMEIMISLGSKIAATNKVSSQFLQRKKSDTYAAIKIKKNKVHKYYLPFTPFILGGVHRCPFGHYVFTSRYS